MKTENLDDHVAEFSKYRPALVHRTEGWMEELRQWLRPLCPLAIVEGRVKEVASFAEKILRKAKYMDPLREITDLAGARVVTPLSSEADRVVVLLRSRYKVDESHSIDMGRQLRRGEFGYRSHHLVVVLDPGEALKAGLPESWLPLRVEVQVRTILQHAWAVLGHDRLYKPGFRVPDPWHREAARIAAVLETADREFEEVVEGVEAYQGEFGIHLNLDAIGKELVLLDMVQRHASMDAGVAERRARLALSLGDWAAAAQIVAKFGGPLSAGLWCCLGRARRGLSGRGGGEGGDGTAEFRKAAAMDSCRAEAKLQLARNLEAGGANESESLYLEVLEREPEEPRALVGWMRHRLRSGRGGDPESWAMLARAAIRRCEAWMEVGMHSVEALRLRAFLLLIGPIGTQNEALVAVLEAIQACRISMELGELGEAFADLEPLEALRPGVEVARRCVTLAVLAKFPEGTARTDVMAWVESAKGADRSVPLQGPVWILAGGCASGSEDDVAACAPAVEDILRRFRGTVVSGGTVQGVAGWAGKAAVAGVGKCTSVGYLPEGLQPSESSTPDSRYTELRRRGPGTEFSLHQPLHAWADILLSGIRPRETVVLGINGGVIAAFEYRLAAVLGARVGVIANSGRAATDLDSPAERIRFPGILRIPRDPLTLRMFVLGETGRLDLDPKDLERLAQEVHEVYRKSVPAQVDLSHRDWKDLPADLQESNRDQVRQSLGVLRVAGFEVRSAKGPPRVREFSTEEIESLAEAEHARWVLERLAAGWEWAPVKDVAQKRSPHLAPWSGLGDDVKEWDRRAVRSLASHLAKVGLEVIRMGTEH